jgi:hypothetical protein
MGSMIFFPKAKAAADASVKTKKTYCDSNPNAQQKSRTLLHELLVQLGNQKVNTNAGDVQLAKTSTSMQAGNGESSVTVKNVAELGLYKSRDEESGKLLHSHQSCVSSAHRQNHLQSSPLHPLYRGDDRYNECEGGSDKKTSIYERRHKPEAEQKSYKRHDVSDATKSHRNHKVTFEEHRRSYIT